MSKVIQLGIYVIQFGNRRSSIYKRWCGLQPDFVPVGSIARVMFGDAAHQPRGEASVWLASEAPDLCATPCFGRVCQIRVANDRRSLSALQLDDRPIPTHYSQSPLYRPTSAMQRSRSVTRLTRTSADSLRTVIWRADRESHDASRRRRRGRRDRGDTYALLW